MFDHLQTPEDVTAAIEELEQDRAEIDPDGRLYIGEMDVMLEELEIKRAELLAKEEE